MYPYTICSGTFLYIRCSMVLVLSRLPEDIEDLKKRAQSGLRSPADQEVNSGSSTQVSVAIQTL